MVAQISQRKTCSVHTGIAQPAIETVAVQTASLPAHRRQIRTTPMRHLSGHANALTQRGVRVNRLADIHRVRTHLNGQGNLANHVACMRADHATAQDFAVAVGFW